MNSLKYTSPINSKANTAFSLPHNKRSGARINSIVFIVATTAIWVIALSFDLNFDKTQMAIPISESPIRTVMDLEYSSPNILATICSCLGTRLSTLQKSPFASQTVAIRIFTTTCRFPDVNILIVVGYTYSWTS